MRIGGTVVAVALAVATAIWEVALTPWYVIMSGHVVRVPAAPVLAVLCNVGLLWFTRSVTGKLSLAVFPALAWLAVMVIAGNVTSDGDLLITSNWVGVTTILLGMAGWALPAYRVMLKQQAATLAAARATKPTPPIKASSAAPRPGAKPAAKPSTTAGAGVKGKRR